VKSEDICEMLAGCGSREKLKHSNKTDCSCFLSYDYSYSL